MSDILQAFGFAGTGLNSDDSLEAMMPGDTPVTYGTLDRTNLIVPPDNYDKLRDSWGTTLVTGSNLAHDAAVASVRLMGSGISTDNAYAYYFLYGITSGAPMNSIIRVALADNAITKVLFDEYELEIDINTVFKEAKYLDGWLYYAGGQYGAKKVNVSRAIYFTTYKNSAWDVTAAYNTGAYALYTDGGVYRAGSAVSAGEAAPPNNTKWVLTYHAYPNTAVGTAATLLDGAFDLVNRPPLVRVTGVYASSASRLYNNLRGKMFQFTYRWKYRSGGYSVTAPFSEVFLPPDVEDWNGEILNSFATNNVINLTLDNGSSNVNVEYAELYVRQGEALSWQYVDRIEAGTNTYAFYNDFLMEVASDDMVNKLADAIPTQTRALEILTENVMALGGNTYGYENVVPDVALTVEWDNVILTPPDTSPDKTYTIEAEVVEYGPEIHYNEVTVANITDVDAGDILEIVLYYSTYTVSVNYILQAADVVSASAFRTACIGALWDAAPGPYFWANSIVPPPTSGITITNGDFYVASEGTSILNRATSYVRVYAPAATQTMNKWEQFTTGARHVFGITYYDRAMRPYAICTGADCEVYVPTVPEAKEPAETYDWRNSIAWEIIHEAPTDAKYWQWFYAGNQNISDFWFYVIDSVTAEADTVTLTISIDALQDVQTTIPGSKIGPYVWQKGDRMRAITEAASGSTYGTLIDTDVDLEIKSFDASAKTITVATTASGVYGLGIHSLVEIYRPKTVQSDKIFFAFSPIYETYVYSVGVYHRGVSQDQTGTTVGSGAKGTFTKGDSYLISRGYGIAIGGSALTAIHLVESQSWSDFYDSAWWSQGKVNVESDKGQVVLNNVAISNRYIQDTDINGLCTFDASDVKELPNKYGYVNGLVQIGNVLRVIQQRKRSSFYVGMTEIVDAYGNVNVVKSSEILGTRRELDGDWGTDFPETICRVGDSIYYLDLYNGAFVQDSENGAFPVSDYKMRKWFLDFRTEYLAGGFSYKTFYSEYNEDLRSIFLLRYMEGQGMYILLYHLPTQRWVSFLADNTYINTTFTGFVRLKNRFYFFDTISLYEYVYNVATTREYCGSTTKAAANITVVANEQPLIPKILDTVGVVANEKTGWAVNTITIPADQSNMVPAVSKALDADWIVREGVARAPVKRNMTTSGVSVASDLFEGEKMRGRVAKVTFTLPTQTTGYVEVTAFEIGMTTSK